ncbi:hypothetical protein C8R42DRAFT_717988 [Lentinula raphanica]|nr:hypothetical protein C8R42DRAFT_724215 [Lentinula raphanica]KAJ3727166.1 hypothetical protein C8R42DRAFT_717988 [Lentinula raphanica]
MLFLSMVIAAIAAPVQPELNWNPDTLRVSLANSKTRNIAMNHPKKYNVVVSQKSTSQSSKTHDAYLTRKKPHELYSPTELWTVGLQAADSDVGWWGYRTQRTDSPPFKWTPLKDKHHGLAGAQATKHVKPIIIGTVTMPQSIKRAVTSAVNKELIQHHSTELPSLIYNNHTLTFYWKVLLTYAEGDNPQVTGLREGFKLENWVDSFFTGMVKMEGSGAGFAITELWERELYARIQNGQLDIDRMLKLVNEPSVRDSAESVWEKVLEKLREELGPVELGQGEELGLVEPEQGEELGPVELEQGERSACSHRNDMILTVLANLLAFLTILAAVTSLVCTSYWNGRSAK